MRFTIKNTTGSDIIIPYSDTENETFSPDEEVSFRDLISVKNHKGASGLVAKVLNSELTVYRDGVPLGESEGHVIVNSAVDYVENDNITIKDEDLKSDIDQNVTTNKYLILLFVDSSVKQKSLKNINYKKELSSGECLHPVHNIGLDGLIQDTTYYADYVDAQNLGTEVLKVVEEYVVDENEPIPSAKSVLSRVKYWDYKKTDGTYDRLNYKPKTYDTLNKRAKEGIARRENIINRVKKSIGYCLVFTGNASGDSEAEDLMGLLLKEHSAGFATYKEGGKGPLFSDLEADVTFSWLDAVVPDIAQTQAMIPECVGKDLRTIAVDKLKGLL